MFISENKKALEGEVCTGCLGTRIREKIKAQEKCLKGKYSYRNFLFQSDVSDLE